jgi:hypothetical protein
MKPHASFPSLHQGTPFRFLRGERGSQENGLAMDEPVHDAVCEVIT